MRRSLVHGAPAITAALVLAASGLVMPAASAATTLPPGVTEEAVLQDPTTSSSLQDMTLHNRVLQMVQETPPGASIHFPLFSLSWEPFTDAVIAARDRGVAVYVVGNGKFPSGTMPEMDRLREALGPDHYRRCYTAPTETTEAFRGCIPARPNSFMHAKFFAFSQTGSLSNVVAVTSTNMTNSQLTQYNDMIITSGDQVVYDGYRRYFDDMWNLRRDNDYTISPNGTVRSAATGTTSYFSPRADSSGGTDAELSTDTVALTMRPLAGGPGCSMKVMIREYESSRSPITDQLVRLREEGCDVRVLHTEASSAVVTALTDAGVPLRRVAKSRPGGGTTVLHNKMYLMAGTYDGVPGVRQVHTGSHNWLRASLRSGDEVLIGSDHAPVVDAYDAYFERAWAAHE